MDAESSKRFFMIVLLAVSFLFREKTFIRKRTTLVTCHLKFFMVNEKRLKLTLVSLSRLRLELTVFETVMFPSPLSYKMT
jgi:hypothetical protein